MREFNSYAVATEPKSGILCAFSSNDLVNGALVGFGVLNIVLGGKTFLGQDRKTSGYISLGLGLTMFGLKYVGKVCG